MEGGKCRNSNVPSIAVRDPPLLCGMETFLMKQYKPNISVGWSCVPSWHTAQVNPSSSCMASISSIHDNCFLADVDDDVDDNACFVEILFLPPLLLLMLLLGEVTAFNTAVTRSLEVAIAPMMEARDDTAEDADVVDEKGHDKKIQVVQRHLNVI